MSNYVLVIGSAHLDILADYGVETKDNIDKIGNLKIALGGSAYNIAINLGSHQVKTAIFTSLKTGSLSGKLIKESLEEKKIITDYIEFDDFISESGFVAHRLSGKLESAVSATTIDQIILNDGKLNQAISKANVVIADCNLSPFQIESIIAKTKLHSKSLFICSVSESKVKRAIDIKTQYKFNYTLFCLNSLEAKKNFDWYDITDSENVKSLCNFYSSENVIITNGKLGYSVFSIEGKRRDFQAPNVPVVKSELGAGDALLAALAAHYSQKNTFVWESCAEIISRFVQPVLSVEEGTPGASKAPELVRFIETKNFSHTIFGDLKKLQDPFDVFFLIPFNKQSLSIFETHITPVFQSFNLSCGTAKDIFTTRAIMDDIWAGINAASIVIADCTGRNPNVFYEIGIAHTLGKITILLTENPDDVPFDLKFIRFIKYEYSPDGMVELQKTLRRTIELIMKDL